MSDNRLRDPKWRARVGFDNIDPRPWRPVVTKREPDAPITKWFGARDMSIEIDGLNFGRKAR